MNRAILSSHAAKLAIIFQIAKEMGDKSKNVAKFLPVIVCL